MNDSSLSAACRAFNRSHGARASQGPRSRRGLTLLELVVALGVLTVGLLGFLQSIVYAMNLARAQREIAVASEAGRRAMENMRGATFGQVFKLYNVDPNDDPGGAGTGPGANIAVAGLRPLPGDADGAVGQITFPSRTAGTSVALRENVVDTDFGTPRDLNGDGVIDTADHTNDYRILPVMVRFDWLGATGPHHVVFKNQISDF
jgi:type II secretory pathway pseudopilin PulG